MCVTHTTHTQNEIITPNLCNRLFFSFFLSSERETESAAKNAIVACWLAYSGSDNGFGYDYDYSSVLITLPLLLNDFYCLSTTHLTVLAILKFITLFKMKREKKNSSGSRTII